MDIQYLRKAARGLVTKADQVLAGEIEQESLTENWSELEVIYVHARRLLDDSFSLVGTKKDWLSIRKCAHSIERECDRLGPRDDDEEPLAGA